MPGLSAENDECQAARLDPDMFLICFGEYIVEISFEPEISNDILTGYTEITTDNLDAIRYRIS